MKTFYSSIAVATVAALSVFASASSRADDLAHADKSFLTNAYEDGLAEVTLAELGSKKSGNADVKSFAARVGSDHSKCNMEMKALADSKKVTLAKDVTTMAKAKQKMLEAKSGADFDKAFASAMVSGHKKAVKSFEKASTEAKDADIKAFAAKTLPTLKEHLSMGEDLQKKTGAE
jgi:putative membrane protein